MNAGPMPNMPGGQIAPLPGNSYGGPLPGPPQAAAAPSGPSRVLMLNNLLTATTIWDDQERQEVTCLLPFLIRSLIASAARSAKQHAIS